MPQQHKLNACTTVLILMVGLAAGLTAQTACAENGTPESKSDAASPLQSYYRDIWSRLQKKWWVPEELMFKRVQLHMIIEKDGHLSTVTMAKSSGDPRADSLAMIAAKRAAPFGPLPEGLPTPFDTIYTIGFASSKDKEWVLFNGKHYGRGESYTLPTGTTVGHGDRFSSDLDKQFHLKKEAALTKMNKLYDELAEEDKITPPSVKKANLLIDYANCLIVIQEQAEAKAKLTEALAILENNKVGETDLYPGLSQLAQLTYSIGDLAAAEPLFKRVLAIKESAPAPDASKDGAYKNLLELYAKLLYKQNRVHEADQIYKKIKELD